MKPTKKTLLYTAYIIGITMFFLWYLFPSDTLKDYLADRLGRGSDLTVTIDRISPVLPPGLKLHEVDISHQDTASIEIESLKIMPGLGSLFSDTTTVNFNGRIYEGTLSGRAEISADPKGSGIKINGNIAGVQVQQISALQQLSDHEISGGLAGQFVYADEKQNPKLSGTLTLTNCRLELATAIFNQKSFEFKNIDADLTLQDRNLVINRFSATGNQLDLKIAGRINLITSDSAKNALNLTGTVTPHHVFLAKIEKDMPVDFLRNNKTGRTAISFKVDGTLDEPGFSLN